MFKDYFEIMIPTVETTRINFMVNKLLKNQVHTLVYGSPGTGKTLVLANLIKKLD